jgi:5,10-methenyltetrahydromethanopterin hydrogenase
MAMARAARGNVSILFPKGIDRINDISNDLHAAIQHADMVLGWFENLPKDETPPEWMWPFSDEIKGWFEEVTWAREQKYGGGGDSYADMDSNEYAKNLK